MEIPVDSLEPETLRRVVEEYVTREGTDYGVHEGPLAQKVDQVIRQLKKGEALLLFDPESESCHIVSRSQYPHGRPDSQKTGREKEKISDRERDSSFPE